MNNITDRLSSLSPEQRKLLEMKLKGKMLKDLYKHEKNLSSPIVAVGEKDYYPLSAAQRRLYILSQMEENITNYNMPDMVIIEGNLNREKLENSFKAIVERHETLRTSFGMENGEPVQRIKKEVVFKVDYLEDNEKNLEEIIKSFIRPFKLEEAPLLRVRLVKLSECRHAMLFDMHHIISDGISMNILVKEFSELYEGDELQPLKIQYKDFSAWQNEYFTSEAIKSQEKYWLEIFSGELPTLEMPTDYKRSAVQSFEGDRITFNVEEYIGKELNSLAKETGTTLYMILLAAYNVLLYRYTGQEDIIVGSPVAGRPHADLNEIIGMFVNTLAMRNSPKGEKTFREFLQEVKERCLRAYENQDYPFEELVEKLNIKRDMSRNPIFDTLFTLQNTGNAELEVEGLRFIPKALKNKTSKFDITLSATEAEGKIFFELEYCTALFKKGTIDRLAEHFINILTDIARDSKAKLSEIKILSEEEKGKILYEFNNTRVEYPKDKTIQQLFEEQAEINPEATAVAFEDKSLSYRELNQKANSLAKLLREKGVGNDTIVGILAERSLEMVIGVISILKAGGAYLPIDAKYPEDRIKYMLNDSGAQILLTTKELLGVKSFDCTLIEIDEPAIYKEDVENLVNINKSNSLAYIIYTSGTTGKPKGVMVEHKNVVRLVKNINYVRFEEGDKILQTGALVFDASTFEIWGALLNGLELCLADENTILNAKKLEEKIKSQKITTLWLTSPLFNQLSQENPEIFRGVKNLLVGGDKLSSPHINAVLRNIEYINIINGYGPTENTTFSTCFLIDSEYEDNIPIGKPINNSTAYIFDKNRELQPIGVFGELYVGGDGISRGYLSRPELTEEKFVENPFCKGEKLYRTGDLARWLPDGNIEFLGRIDHQVKIRGFRIELGEIETGLLRHEKVNDAVVLAKEDDSGNKYLCGYYAADGEIGVAELRDHLSKELPDYMIPSYFIHLEKLPLTSNGKVDRRALPEPDASISTGAEYIPPTNEVEEKLAEVWQELLGIKRVGINDNFFELGGHSLKATLLLSKIHKEFNVEIPLREIFNKPTVKGIAEYVIGAKESVFSSIVPIEEKEYYPLSAAQNRLFILSQMEEASISYNMPGMIMVEGALDKEKLEKAFSALINRHGTLRTAFSISEGEPVQHVKNEVEFKVDYFKVHEKELDKVVRSFIRPFNLEEAPLLRVGLVKLSEGRHAMLFDMHHIISDGVSMNILVKEFAELYEGVELPALKIQYKDFSAWQNELFASEVIKDQEKYWLELFDGELPTLELPTDYKRSAVQSFEGDRITFNVEESIGRELNNLAKETGTTLYMILLAAYNVLLYRYTGQEDIIVGSPVAGRPHADLNEIIGMFVNTLAMRNSPKGEKTFKEFLQEVKERCLRAYENQDYPFEELVETLNIKRDMSRNPIFDTMFTLQNTGNAEIEIEGLRFIPKELKNKTSKFDITLSATEAEGKIHFELEYCTALFKKETMDRLAEHFINILTDITKDSKIKLSKIKMLSEEEKGKILNEFNNTKVEYPKDKTIQQLFEEQVERSPETTAVVFEGSSLSYSELNQKANALAKLLREKGVGNDTIVGILAERSLEMVIGVMGILKAGGAYLPIDAKYPEDRIKYMLNDSGAEILLTTKELLGKKSFDCTLIEIDEASIYKDDVNNRTIINTPNSLAYIIYTSGTTGKPKGVMVEHKNVVRLVKNTNYVRFEEGDRILQTGALVFDASTFEIWGALLNGLELCLADENTILNAKKLEEKIKSQKITTLWLTAPLFNQLSQENPELFRGVKNLLVGGDKLSTPYINAVLRNMENINIINGYGPTENTTFSTCFLIDNEYEDNIPIGKPINNSTAYIFDRNRELQPIGVFGELYVGGDGISRGYLRRPELTEEKFVENPFCKGEKLYRTGDLARWLPDGNIEFLGRIDHQVKIRGFRIELGEIETGLLRHESIKETIVLAKEDGNGNKYLCGYYVAEAEISVAELRAHLSKELPDYMIPSYFIALDKLPLTSNGKIDRRALPEPDGSMNTGAEYVPPSNEVEEKLAEVWQELLGIKRVGINDNFFELGGDSIKAIQMSSRLHKYGMKIEIRDLMRNPNIHELSKLVKINEKNLAEQGTVVGEVSLTPIQKWFFEKNFTGMQHWNQAVMLHGKNGFDEELLKKVFNEILKHHDALRLAYTIEDDNVSQHMRGLNEGELYSLKIVDLRDKENIEKIVFKEASRIQSEMNLNKGPLVKLGLFKTNDGDELLIAVHHLAVDGISWRIIFEDLALGYQQALDKGNIVFSNKTTSFKEWSLKIQEYADSKKLLKERDYWRKVSSKLNGHIPVDNLINERRVKECKSTGILLTEEETEKLLRGANRAYNTEINDILLTALGMAIKEWAGIHNITVNLEGHGREDIGAKADVSRTVGWFTSAYPVVLEMKSIEDVSYSIKAVKETLRRIPNKGVGYGILKYLKDEEYIKDINFKDEPEISFNYLGSFGSDIDTGVFSMSKYSSGQPLHPDSEAPFKIDINGMITGNKLSLDFRYHVEEYRAETIDKLVELYREHLVEIIEHCALKASPELTPSDYHDISLEIEELVNIKEVYGEEIESIYRLTPMQEGMLYHTLGDSSSSTYFEQLSFDIKGEIDIGAAAKSIHGLVEKYQVLRTAFIYRGVDRPRQIVLKERSAPVILKDFSTLSEKERDEAIESFETKDRESGFDLGYDSLLRVAFLKLDSTRYKIIWSFHHIILDGWCLPIIFGDFFKNYTTLIKGEAISKEEITPYSQYLSWLENQDPEEVKKYWPEYLGGYDEKAVVPRRSVKNAESQYMNKSMNCIFSKEMTAGLVKLAKDQKVTLNTLFETLWGIILQRYNNTKDVVFGKVVSGRPSEIGGVEKMVGLFINTIPVRVNSDEDMTFEELLKRIHQNAVGTGKYSYSPLAEIQELSDLKGQLIDHLIVFENYPLGDAGEKKGLDSSFEIVYDSIRAFEQTNYDFNIVIAPGDEMVIRFNYNALAYEEEMIEAIGGHFKVLAESIVKNPKEKLSKLEILTEKEKEEILYDFNDTKAEYPKDKTIQQLFEEQVERSPERTAVVFEGRTFSYHELNQRANSLALVLREKGVKPDTIVGILVERSLEMIVGIMGILKAGGAYLPISPDYPEDRIRYIVEDSGAKLLLTGQEHKAEFGVEVLGIDSGAEYDLDAKNPEPINKPEDLAYIIYTSGSTGNPKGVMIEHRTAVNLLSALEERYPLGQDDTFLLKTTYTFDVSVAELFGWFRGEGRLAILEPNDEKDPAKIVEAIEKYKVTHINFVPSMLSAFLEVLETEDVQALKSLKYVFSAGEALQIATVKKYYSLGIKAALENLYGPTESTVYATWSPVGIDMAEAIRVPIGEPLKNIKAYILNENGKPQPVGVAGELYLSGAGLARGYLNRDELTKEKFVDNPFDPGEKMYRTGDLARWLPDGNIEYLGRIDHQVKIRGFRIELGEIEAHLLKHEKIAEAVVVAKGDKSGSSYLCGYYTADEELKLPELREHLSKELPEYMIPSYFIHLEKLPLTQSGKVNRKALPEPEQSINTGALYAEPTNEAEEKLVKIWQELLGVERVGINDNFFELGGHSLKAIQLIIRIRKDFGSELSLAQVFQNPTIEQTAKCLQFTAQESFEETTATKNYIVMNEKSNKKIFAFPPIAGSAMAYKHLGDYLNTHAIYSFDFLPDMDRIDKYINMITNIEKNGVYTLMGYSAGGNLAFEIAKEMELRGYQVADIIMIDSYRKIGLANGLFNNIINEHEVKRSIKEFFKGNEDDIIDTEVIAAKLLDTSKKYSNYIKDIENVGMVKANIHVIKSESSVIDNFETSWSNATLGSFNRYYGSGEHDKMISNTDYLKYNSEILNIIL